MSGNECAEPTCKQRVIAASTPESDEAVIAQISQIYSVSDDGLGGSQGLRRPSTTIILTCFNVVLRTTQRLNRAGFAGGANS